MPNVELNGAVALVTGGSRGIGRVIAGRLLGAGANVVICGRREPETLPTSVDGSLRATFVCADVREVEQVQATIRATVDRHHRLDILVNNAGGSPFAEAATASPRFHESIIRLNLLAPLNMAQEANRIMQTQNSGGVIINIASVSGTRASPGTAAYGAAKAGLLNLTQTLAVEWAPKVRVNAVTAGLVATEAADEHYGGPDGIARVSATVPLGRMGSPMDVANAVLFLASRLASYASGSNLLLHGGGEWPAFLKAAQGE